MKLSAVLLFGFIVFFTTIQFSHGETEGLSAWFIVALISLIFLPVGYYLVQSMAKQVQNNIIVPSTLVICSGANHRNSTFRKTPALF